MNGFITEQRLILILLVGITIWGGTTYQWVWLVGLGTITGYGIAMLYAPKRRPDVPETRTRGSFPQLVSGQIADDAIIPSHLSQDVLDLISGGGVDTSFAVFTHTVTAYEISQKSITLPHEPLDSIMALSIIGGAYQRFNVDYALIESPSGALTKITWDASTYGTLTSDLETLLYAGIQLQALYKT